jgi:hypothetical protein
MGASMKKKIINNDINPYYDNISEMDIALKISADPIAAAAVLCRQEDYIIKLETELHKFNNDLLRWLNYVRDYYINLLDYGDKSIPWWGRRVFSERYASDWRIELAKLNALIARQPEKEK